MMSGLLKVLAFAAVAYLCLVAVMAMAQTALLFPRWAVMPAPSLPAGAEALTVRSPDGAELHGHRLPGQGGGAPVIAFGGNAWNAADVALFLHRILPESDVVAFHYRGYAPSSGRPSARALAEDALTIHDALAADGMEAPILVGFSIGAGPAAELAAARPVRGVLLITPFDSLEGLARAHYPWAPVRLLLRHRMEPAARLAAAGVPVALIAAARDEVVPPARTEALRRALDGASPGVILDRTLQAGHNDLYAHPDLAPALREAAARLQAPPGP